MDKFINSRKSFFPYGSIYGVIAAPPCTHFASSGARWWSEKGKDAIVDAMINVRSFFDIIWKIQESGAILKFWCLENPVGRLSRFIGPPVNYYQPCEFGDPWTKKFGLWGKYNEPKKNRVHPTQGSKFHTMSSCKNRADVRSVTPPGFAKAFYEANK